LLRISARTRATFPVGQTLVVTPSDKVPSRISRHHTPAIESRISYKN